MSLPEKTPSSGLPANFNAGQILRVATLDDYADFLIARLQDGGKIGHAYPYTFAQANTDHVAREDKIRVIGRELAQYNFFVATGSGYIDELYGADSIRVIVPKEIETMSKDGHNDLFSMSRPLDSHVNSMGLYIDVVKCMMEKGFEVKRDHLKISKEEEWDAFTRAYASKYPISTIKNNTLGTLRSMLLPPKNG